MPSLIDIRRRIRSVRNTQQITKAMKMVSAAKLRRAQDRVIAARPYSALLRQVLADVAAAAGSPGAAQEADSEANPLLARRPEQRILLTLVTADKGLAGAFNSNLNKGALQFIDEHKGASMTLELVGRKGRDFFRKRGAKIAGEQIGLPAQVPYSEAAAIAQSAMDLYRREEIDAIYLLYNEFKSVMSQRFTVRKVLPIDLSAGREEAAPVPYIFEQPPEAMLNDLLPRYVEMEFYEALLESTAAEHAARMTAMDAATSNASEMIDKLTLHLNRVRQASITKEIIEVVSGAAAQ